MSARYSLLAMKHTADPCKSGWVERHVNAIYNPKGAEIGVVSLLRGWLEYANTHKELYESGIGQDGFLGEHWEAIGHALLALLNGDCGRLDCGTLDGLIRDVLTAEGFDADT